jgi:organic hydroperoxide reductase OsmC/OhrA
MSARRFEHSVALDREGRMRADGSSPLELEEAWTPEHLVLTGLVRCTIASLRFYAEKTSVAVEASGGADGVVTKREDDGRYAFTEIECGLDVELEPRPEDAELAKLLDSAEWGCFVGGSLTAKPRYEWRVNGEVVPR